LEVRRRHAALRELDRGLEHGEREGLDAVAVDGEVRHLHLGQSLVNVGLGRVALEEVAELALGDVETRLAVPERVVAVESHRPERHRDEGLSALLPASVDRWGPGALGYARASQGDGQREGRAVAGRGLLEDQRAAMRQGKLTADVEAEARARHFFHTLLPPASERPEE